MKIIGLTGPSGAGKGEVATVLSSMGLPVLDADEIYHALLIPPSRCLDELVTRFGEEILLHDGTLNRKVLGEIVFSDPIALSDLNSISHNYVMIDVRHQLDALAKTGIEAAVFDAPQLFEAGAERLCDAVISVLADEELRTLRIMARDGIDHAAAQRRIRAQHSDEFFRAHSTYVIENNGTVEDLLPKVRRILSDLGVTSACE